MMREEVLLLLFVIVGVFLFNVFSVDLKLLCLKSWIFRLLVIRSDCNVLFLILFFRAVILCLLIDSFCCFFWKLGVLKIIIFMIWVLDY